jgi:cysteine desulfurase/selenocysteine lyase
MTDLRKDFPFFNSNQQAVFFDSAASTQKPMVMIDRLSQFYSNEYANIHRGIYDLSANATQTFENARKSVARFINAASTDEIIFTKNATEGLNLIAASFAGSILAEDDEMLISAMEHHANIIPWQQICAEQGAKLRIIPINQNGDIELQEIEKLISSKTKIISITHMSNIFGSIVAVASIIKLARKNNIKVIIDACQSVAHMHIDVQSLDCDFLVFSAHKLYGPTGVGIVYGKKALLNEMPPYQTGGATIKHVTFAKSRFLPAPLRFEAGTPMIAEVIAFGTVLDYLTANHWQENWQNEKEITSFIKTEIKKMKGFKVLGDNQNGIISLLHEKAHHADIGEILNQQNIAIRTGHHCAQPLMETLSITGTARISLGIYNNFSDAEKLLQGLQQVNKLF